MGSNKEQFGTDVQRFSELSETLPGGRGHSTEFSSKFGTSGSHRGHAVLPGWQQLGHVNQTCHLTSIEPRYRDCDRNGRKSTPLPRT